MNIWLAVAAAGGALILGIHLFAGGREIAKPLLAARGLDDTVRYTHYYCWHLVSIAIGVMAASLGWAAIAQGETGLAIMGTTTAAAFAIWGLILPPAVGQRYLHMPQGWLFLPVALLGGIGLAW